DTCLHSSLSSLRECLREGRARDSPALACTSSPGRNSRAAGGRLASGNPLGPTPGPPRLILEDEKREGREGARRLLSFEEKGGGSRSNGVAQWRHWGHI